MYEIKSKNLVYVLMLTFLLVLSFTPAESGVSSLAIYFRLLPFLIFLLIVIIKNINVKVSYSGVVLTILFCVIIIFFKFIDINKRLMLQVLIIILTYLFVCIINNKRSESDNFLLVLSLLISIWVFFLLVQFVIYYFTGKAVDLHSVLFPFSEGRGAVGDGYIIRFGGLHIEPGTYSNWLLGVVVLRAFLKREISTPLHWIAIISTLLTLSFWAYLSFIIFVIAVSLEKKISGNILLIISVSLMALIFFYVFGSDVLFYLQKRSQLDTGTATGKLDVYNYLIINVEDWILVGSRLTSIPCDYCTSYQDAGVGFNLFFYFGSLMIFVFGMVFFRAFQFFGVKGVVLIIPIFFAKYYYWDPITILLMVFILAYRRAPALVETKINR